MHRPFTRHQALQNAAFLRELRRTGNTRDAARTLGVHRSTFTKRRAKHPAFAADWDAALAIAHANLNPLSAKPGEGDHVPLPAKGEGGAPNATPDTEPRAIRTRSGRLQLRRAQPKRLTRADEQAFLAALSATANVRLSAKAAGFSHSAFYHRRKHSPAFAREMRLALEMGYERVELALLESYQIGAFGDDAWRQNDPPAMPRMTVDQGMQLLYLHQKEVRLQAEPPHLKRRRGQSREAMFYYRAEMYRAEEQRKRDEFVIAETARRARGEPAIFGPKILPPLPVLPPLDQVTGWSKASGKPPHHEGRALFGGWRLGDWKKR